MKKILILGGAKAQVPLIKAAKQEGYFVVLCDWTTTNPGIALADKHYQVSTLDISAVLKVAQDEKINGVISNSEPAMVTVAAVAEKLGLVGNTVESTNQLQSKHSFRALQKKCGAFAPNSVESDNLENLVDAVKKFSYPVIMKPSKSSGSRGTTVIEKYDYEAIKSAFSVCKEFSKDKKVTCEEYVKMPTLVNIGADAFVYKDTILWNGLYSAIRSKHLLLVPTAEVFPSLLTKNERIQLEKTIQTIVQAAHFQFGEINIEAYYTEENNLFIIEINVRQGGNHIPELIFEHCGIDMYKLLVTMCMNDHSYFDEVAKINPQQKYITNALVFSRNCGVLQNIHIDSNVEKYVYNVEQIIPNGQNIYVAQNATDAIGMIRMEFPNREIQLEVLMDLENMLYAEIENDS